MIIKYKSMNLSSLYKRYIRIVPGVRSYVLAAVMVFVLGMCVTLYSWHSDKQQVVENRDAALNEQLAKVESDIVNRLTIYEQIIKGASGLFEASDSVDQASLQNFIAQFNLKDSYPGIQAIGYAEYVKANDLPVYLDKMRNEGKTDIKVTPEGDRPEYALLTYSYSTAGKPSRSYGYDILTFPARQALASSSRDSGNIEISEKIILIGDKIDDSDETGFLMYLPLYKKGMPHSTIEERRNNLQGYLYAGYRASDFFRESISESSMGEYKEIQIFDGKSTKSENMLYQSADFSKFASKDISKSFEYQINNRTWTLRFAAPIDSGSDDAQRSNIILFGGATLSLAIAAFLFVLMLNRAREIVYVKQKETQQAKDDLLSLASHQLRTPATAVKQYLGMILEGYSGKVNKNILPSLQKAYSSNERQLETINQILYVAKADAGRLSINPQNFDINRLIDDIVADSSDSLEENGQIIELVKDEDELCIYADEASIRMVIENLLSNASKYSYKDSKITIKTYSTQHEVYIEVKDEGVGISSKDYDKLFKKFSRIDNDLSVEVGGSGIGLYIDKVLIELHGGKITVDSQLENGSKFTIKLPNNAQNESNITDDS